MLQLKFLVLQLLWVCGWVSVNQFLHSFNTGSYSTCMATALVGTVCLLSKWWCKLTLPQCMGDPIALHPCQTSYCQTSNFPKWIAMKCYFIVALFGVSSLLIKLNIFSNFWKEDYLAFCALLVCILVFFFFNGVVCLYLIHLLEVLCIFWVIIFFSTMRYENISPVSVLYFFTLLLLSFDA